MGAGASTNLAWEPSVLGPSAHEIINQIHSGERTCVEVVQASLDRIALLETSERPLNACVETLTESALAAAEAVDAKVKHKRPLGPLEGLPIVVKVNIDVKGALTTASTAALKGSGGLHKTPPASPDSWRQGQIVGRANMCELAVGFSGSSPVHGLCLNPRNPAINVGGSSSGTAAASLLVWCRVASDRHGRFIAGPGGFMRRRGLPAYEVAPQRRRARVRAAGHAGAHRRMCRGHLFAGRGRDVFTSCRSQGRHGPQNRHTEGLARHGAAGLGRERPRRARCGFCSSAQERRFG